MRQLIVSEFVTLDGVMEAPGGEPTHPHTDWVSRHEGGHDHFAYKLKEILDAEILLVGRVTYESFAGAWPEREGEFADKLNPMPKVVVSGTLTDPGWKNTTVLPGGEQLGAGITGLKAGGDGPILVHGSATLVHALLDHDLVDELRLMVFPVTIGSGLRVFPDTVREVRWNQVDSVTFPSRVRVDTYHRA